MLALGLLFFSTCAFRVSSAAGELQTKELIHYARGRITILGPEGHEVLSCECYRILRANPVLFDRVTEFCFDGSRHPRLIFFKLVFRISYQIQELFLLLA
jgi:hypothetical protein